MLGWEFPPFNVGGLGVACHGLAKSLVKKGADLTIVLPKAPPEKMHPEFKIIGTSNYVRETNFEEYSKEFKIKKVESLLYPYMNERTYQENYKQIKRNLEKQYDSKNHEFNSDLPYGKNLIEEIHRYAFKVLNISKKSHFDIIHAHDWMTYPAGIKAKESSGKPLILHIHNTAYDRSGGNPNPIEYEIEKEGFQKCDKVIAISNFVKNTLISKYNIPSKHIEVIHNGIDTESYTHKPYKSKLSQKDKIVLFAGRVTLQKGPDYFLKTAQKISKHKENVKFVLAGDGDMQEKIINMSAEMGISDRFIFTGRYTKEEGEKLMSMADVFVMPSVAEPFGLVPLESMIQRTPTIISKQSGVSEVIENTLKADFWDIEGMANKIMAALEYPALYEQLQEYGEKEAKNMTWNPTANKCINLYKDHIEKYN